MCVFDSSLFLSLSKSICYNCTHINKCLCGPGYNIVQTHQVSEMTGIFQPAIPVIEMTLCSKARIIIANQYSTYSRAIFKKAVWKRKHMTKLSFAWSKTLQNMTYYVDSWQSAGPYVNENHWI